MLNRPDATGNGNFAACCAHTALAIAEPAGLPVLCRQKARAQGAGDDAAGGDGCGWTARAAMTFALFVEQLFNGVQFGLMLFLMAVGVKKLFGIDDGINLAQGALFMVGG